MEIPKNKIPNSKIKGFSTPRISLGTYPINMQTLSLLNELL
jgi:hypothetical protein